MRLLLIYLMLSARMVHADQINLRADPWCPYTCDDAELPGYMIEVAREALAPFGHEVNFEFVSWSRAIQQAEDGQIDGIVGGIPVEAPNLVWSGPLFPFVDAVIFRRGEGQSIARVEDLDGLRLGVINDYDYYGVVNDYIAAQSETPSVIQFAAGFQPLTTNLRKLIAGRIDAVAETEAVVRHRATQMGIMAEIEILSLDAEGFVEIGFSPLNDQSSVYARQLLEGVEALKSSGRFAEIMAKYGQ